MQPVAAQEEGIYDDLRFKSHNATSINFFGSVAHPEQTSNGIHRLFLSALIRQTSSVLVAATTTTTPTTPTATATTTTTITTTTTTTTTTMLAKVQDIPFQTQIYRNLHECYMNMFPPKHPAKHLGNHWKDRKVKVIHFPTAHYLTIFQPEQISWWWSPPAWAARWVWSHSGNIPRATPHPADPARSYRQSRGPGTAQLAGRADHLGQWPSVAIRIWVGQPQVVVLIRSYLNGVNEWKCGVYKALLSGTKELQHGSTLYRTWVA